MLFYFFVHSSKFQLSWWIYLTRVVVSLLLHKFPHFLWKWKVRFVFDAANTNNKFTSWWTANLHCINPQQSYRWWRLLLYKSSTSSQLFHINVTRFFSALSGDFFLSFTFTLCVVKMFQVGEKKSGKSEEHFSCKYLMKTFLLSALLFNIRLRVLSFIFSVAYQQGVFWKNMGLNWLW